MGFMYEQRGSDSPYVETITQGRTEGSGSVIRPAECHWHLVIVKYMGHVRVLAVGPLTAAGTVSWTAGAEILWIKFKLGTFMPHLPASVLLDKETRLPEAGSRTFWLKGSSWQLPTSENADTFVERLARAEVLAHDPVVEAVLQGHCPALAPRTLRHRFLRATGLAQGTIHQMERAQRAAALLEQGLPILDTVYDAGYFDQPQLTRSLKRWVGHTPGQLLRTPAP
jgi:AraC-like DNA-binding protein